MLETEKRLQTLNRVSAPRKIAAMLPNEWMKLALDAAHMCAYRLDLRTNVVVRSHKPTSGFEFDPTENSWNLRERSLPNIHPEDRQLVEDMFFAKAKSGEQFNIECRLLLASGEIRWIQLDGCPIVDENGLAAEALAVTQDITERKRAESLLRQRNQELLLAQARLQFALESAEMAVFINDREQSMLRSAELCKFIGLEFAEEIEFAAFVAMIPPQDLAEFNRGFDTPRINGNRIEHEFRLVTPGGVVKWMMAKGTILLDPADGLMKDFVVFQDITKRKEQETALKRKNAEVLAANSKLNHFAAIVAHDLKGPLGSISMAADLISSATSLDEVFEFAAFVKSAANRMAGLISDLLQLAKSDKGSMAEKEVVDLSALLEIVSTNLRAAITESNARIGVGPLPKVRGYSIQLTQLLQNLVANALKFRGTGPPVVQISAEERADHSLIAVMDHGVGIDAAHIGELFEPFKRFHAGQFEGTGLGLAICKQVVELHGGKIWVESKPGLGSTFFFTLPKEAI